jgi:RimJ/RimL family protein N-acetyltransferase
MKIIEPGLTLETDRVLLRSINESDFDAFYQLAQDENMWKYFTLNLADKIHLQKWMDAAFVDRQPAREDLLPSLTKLLTK